MQKNLTCARHLLAHAGAGAVHVCTVGGQPFKKVSCASVHVKQAHVRRTVCICTLIVNCTRCMGITE